MVAQAPTLRRVEEPQQHRPQQGGRHCLACSLAWPKERDATRGAAERDTSAFTSAFTSPCTSACTSGAKACWEPQATGEHLTPRACHQGTELEGTYPDAGRLPGSAARRNLRHAGDAFGAGVSSSPMHRFPIVGIMPIFVEWFLWSSCCGVKRHQG